MSKKEKGLAGYLCGQYNRMSVINNLTEEKIVFMASEATDYLGRESAAD